MLVFLLIDFVPSNKKKFNYSLKRFIKINKIFFIKPDVSLMGTGVCLKGTHMYPLSTARLFAFNDVYLNQNSFVI